MRNREETRYRVLRKGAEVARVEAVSHYTFDELVPLHGPRTINFYDAERNLVAIIPAEPGDVITDCMIGFTGYAG
jgi:hypothetical protein